MPASHWVSTLETQRLARIAGIGELEIGDQDQRMQFELAARRAHIGAHATQVGLGDDAVGKQRGQGFVEIDAMVQAQAAPPARARPARISRCCQVAPVVLPCRGDPRK